MSVNIIDINCLVNLQPKSPEIETKSTFAKKKNYFSWLHQFMYHILCSKQQHPSQ